jgi:creatinine amidohydrolase
MKPHNREQLHMLKQWNEMNTADFAEPLVGSVFILPVAATEQHGAHLPTGTDTFILEGILRTARRAQSPINGIVLPLQPIGWSVEHGDFPGTLSLDGESLVAAWLSLAHWIERAGARRLLILNSHGGNSSVVSMAAMRMRVELGMLVVTTNWEALARPDELTPAGAPMEDWHAGWVETSVMLHLRPDLVAMERALPGPLHHPAGLPPNGPAPWAWMAGDLSPNGVIGDPRRASAKLGARLVERAVAGLSELLERMAAASWPLPGGASEKP